MTTVQTQPKFILGQQHLQILTHLPMVMLMTVANLMGKHTMMFGSHSPRVQLEHSLSQRATLLTMTPIWLSI
jgi:hypothetical protein